MVKTAHVFGATLLGALASAISMAQGTPSDFKAFRAALKANGLSAVIPPSSDYKPGFVFRFDRNADGQWFPRRICSQLFVTAPITSNITFPQTHRFSDSDISLGLKLLPGGVSEKLSAGFSADFQRAKTVDLKFDRITRLEVPEANSLDPQSSAVVERVVNPACVSNLSIQPVDKKGRFKSKLYIVVRSVSAKGFEFTFDRDGTSGFSLSGALEGVVSGNAGWKVHKTTKQSFRLDSDANIPPIFIASDTVGLESISQSYKISGGKTRVKLELKHFNDVSANPQ
jgi:hypothetical protein